MTDTTFQFEQEALRGRTVLVPGGCGGLGLALVTLLAMEGARIVAGYRANRERARRLADSLERDYDCSVALVGGDLADPQVRGRYLEAGQELGGAPYGLACFSGDPGRIDFASAQADEMVPSLSSNYLGPLLMGRDCAAAMQSQRVPGAIVFLSTMQASGHFPGSYNYAGPKVALTHAARTMAKELGGPDGIRVNVVAPGVNRAGMALKSIESGKYDRFVDDGIIPRFGKAEDVARVVRLLLEPDNYVTGQVITVDGGLTLRA